MKISNIFPCHLSKPIRMRKNQLEDEFIEDRKNYFQNHIQNKRSTFKDKPIFLAKSTEPNDSCFKKFAIGGEEFHRTQKIDIRRIERFDWIFEIIDKIDECKKCGWIKIEQSTRFKNRLTIECCVNNYFIVLIIAEHSEHYEIISAQFRRYVGKSKRKNAH